VARSPRGAVNLQAVLASITEPWTPLTVSTLNDYDVRVVKTHGEFTWHSHPDTDELFLVLSGRLTIRLERGEVELGPGELFVVPRGVRHQPHAADGAEVLLIEPSETVNTGDTPSELTATRKVLGE
jgi:mannose-6-phosphate isomerase-like protein (cupin superfamily)